MFLFVCLASDLWAGPYADAPGNNSSTAISMDSAAFVGWAGGWENYLPGDQVDSTFQTPEKATGKASGNTFDIVCLGREGSVTMIFDSPVRNGDGWDFAVFENSFSDSFIEVAYVEVSSDGVNFLRFDSVSLTPAPVSGFGNMDPTDIDGLAGKYRQGYGTPFDLQDLAARPEVLDGQVNLGSIGYIRLIDIVGDGRSFDSSERPIYDPYPTVNSAGFDLDAVGARYLEGQTPSVNLPEKPVLLLPVNGSQVQVQPTLETGDFADQDELDTHMLTRWQISNNDPAFNPQNILLDEISGNHLKSLTIPAYRLDYSSTCYWRVSYYDTQAMMSSWSDIFSFTTPADNSDLDFNGIPDDQQVDYDWDGDGVADPGVKTAKGVNSKGQQIEIGIEGVSNVAAVTAVMTVEPGSTDTADRPYDLLSGLAAFKVQVVDSVEFVRLKIYLSSPAPSNARWYKYDSINGWREYPHAEFASDRTFVILTLVDGNLDYGDTDKKIDGFIIDPGGSGSPFSPSLPADGESGMGGSGSCFISTVIR